MFDKLLFFLSYLIIRILTINYFAIRKIIDRVLKGYRYNDVLDFGCGIGMLAPLFPTEKYLGFDIDQKAIEYAKATYPKYKFIVGDATNIKLKKTFDLIIVIGVLHHLDNREVKSAMGVMKSLLSREGKILIIEAIPPIFKWNILGQFLRALDNGHFVRTIPSYKTLIGKDLVIEKQYPQIGGILDYGVFIIGHKMGQK